MMKYKRYFGQVTYDNEAKLFHGEVIGLRDVITFQGTTVNEIEKAFRDSVDDYIVWCKKRGEKPEKAYSGRFNVRTTPDIHANLALEAAKRGMSLNDIINERLQK